MPRKQCPLSELPTLSEKPCCSLKDLSPREKEKVARLIRKVLP